MCLSSRNVVFSKTLDKIEILGSNAAQPNGFREMLCVASILCRCMSLHETKTSVARSRGEWAREKSTTSLLLEERAWAAAKVAGFLALR